MSENIINQAAAKKLPGETENNFTILRLLLATLVVFGHFKLIPGYVPTYGPYAYADFAVDAFFVVSGYLIAGSYDKNSHLIGFYVRRLFRIYPLYVVVVLLQALAMVILLGGIDGYVGSTLSYLGYNLIFANFMQYDIGGVLAGQYNPGINPSLWTLKIEVAFYIVLPLVWILTRKFGLAMLIAIYIASAIYTEVCLQHGHETLAKQLPGQMRFFVMGIGLYRYRDYIKLPIWFCAAMAIVLFIICTYRDFIPFTHFIYPAAIGLWVFLCAERLPAIPLKFDISYGVYLFHGPIIQTLAVLGLIHNTMWFLLLLLVAVYALAFVAELIIELPGIEMGKRIARKFQKRTQEKKASAI